MFKMKTFWKCKGYHYFFSEFEYLVHIFSSKYSYSVKANFREWVGC